MNDLERELGLVEENPIEKVMAEPLARNLKRVSKSDQTLEMVRYVCQYDGRALRHVSKKLIDYELCETAVVQNGLSLEYVPAKLIDNRLCELAITDDGMAIKYVPDKFLNFDLVEKAVTHFQFARSRSYVISDYSYTPIAYVPYEYIDSQLILKAVNYCPQCIKDVLKKKLNKTIVKTAVAMDGLSISFVPKRFITDELVEQAIGNNPFSIRYIPETYRTHDRCNRCFDRDYEVFRYLPNELITEDMCLYIITHKLFYFDSEDEGLFDSVETEKCGIRILFEDFPATFRNSEKVLSEMIKASPNVLDALLKWNEGLHAFYEEWEAYPQNCRKEEITPLSADAIEYIKTLSDDVVFDDRAQDDGAVMIVDLIHDKKTLDNPGPIGDDFEMIKSEAQKKTVIHELTNEESFATNLAYYITDIHLEHQIDDETVNRLQNTGKEEQISVLQSFVNKKVDELLRSMSTSNNLLLIGGDVADTKAMSKLFYDCLFSKVPDNCVVISVLGNHELWDGEYESVDDIVNDYGEFIKKRLMPQSFLLENELYIEYQKDKRMVLTEDAILDSDDNELKQLMSKCTCIILGGIGFSGENMAFNAEHGLYRRAITNIEEDKERTIRFQKVYEKIQRCGYDQSVIVLTHTPLSNWLIGDVNPNWIYVNGHTHRNAISRTKTTIFSDNQLGYEPCIWKLNAFSLKNVWYDPFESYKDGIYPVTQKQYLEFNRGRGIFCKGCGYPGTIYMLKRNNMYMFVLQSRKSICLLSGGQRKKLKRLDKQYYYDNMLLYSDKVKNRIEPYKQILLEVSSEVQKVGGDGTIHGCIVDIDWFNHIYINPYDGTISSYWAEDICSRHVFPNILQHFLAISDELYKKLIEARDNSAIPLIQSYLIDKKNSSELIVLPEWMFGTDIYEPSRILKAIQYVWEHNVIRIWNDDFLISEELSDAVCDTRLIEE